MAMSFYTVQFSNFLKLGLILLRTLLVRALQFNLFKRRREMKKILGLELLIMAAIWMISYSPGFNHNVATAEAADANAVKETMRPGKQIRQIGLKGYTLTYHLLDLSERGEMVKMMGHHSVLGLSKRPDVTNHLMVYVQKPDGKIVPGEVAYLLTGPDGKDFRTMTMGMYGGNGADVIMKLKGVYTIRAKIILEGTDAVKLDDEFTFQVK